MNKRIAGLATAWAVCAAPLAAQEQPVAAKASFVFNGERIKIRPDGGVADQYAARFAAVPNACDPACVAPMIAAPGIETLDENAVLAFLVDVVGKNEGLMVDARLPDARAGGYIPGSVSLPAATMSPENSFRDEILKALGARAFEELFNFADVRALVVYDNGPNQSEASQLINFLLESGYPAEKIQYYRGGMQVWTALGLSVKEGKS